MAYYNSPFYPRDLDQGQDEVAGHQEVHGVGLFRCTAPPTRPPPPRRCCAPARVRPPVLLRRPHTKDGIIFGIRPDRQIIPVLHDDRPKDPLALRVQVPA